MLGTENYTHGREEYKMGKVILGRTMGVRSEARGALAPLDLKFFLDVLYIRELKVYVYFTY